MLVLQLSGEIKPEGLLAEYYTPASILKRLEAKKAEAAKKLKETSETTEVPTVKKPAERPQVADGTPRKELSDGAQKVAEALGLDIERTFERVKATLAWGKGRSQKRIEFLEALHRPFNEANADPLLEIIDSRLLAKLGRKIWDNTQKLTALPPDAAIPFYRTAVKFLSAALQGARLSNQRELEDDIKYDFMRYGALDNMIGKR